MRTVVDTNVVFEGLTRSEGAAHQLIELWLHKDSRLEACVSTALAYEYTDVLSRKLANRRWLVIQPQLRMLLRNATQIVPYFSGSPVHPIRATST